MRDKHYNALIKVVNGYLDDITIYFLSYDAQFKKTAEEIKGHAYGGYEIAYLKKEFKKTVHCKCTELLERIEILFGNSGRKLSAKQYKDLTNRCTNKFIAIISNYHSIFQQEFESVKTNEIFFKLLEENIFSKINNYIQALKYLSSAKIDKALWWTATGTAFAAISLILSVISILMQ